MNNEGSQIQDHSSSSSSVLIYDRVKNNLQSIPSERDVP